VRAIFSPLGPSVPRRRPPIEMNNVAPPADKAAAGYDSLVDPSILNYAVATTNRPWKPNWPMRVGLALSLLGWATIRVAVTASGSSPALAFWADRAGGWLALSGLAAGLLAIFTGPRRGWAMVALGVQFAVAVALPVILGPGD